MADSHSTLLTGMFDSIPVSNIKKISPITHKANPDMGGVKELEFK
jgi:hypothetical protein